MIEFIGIQKRYGSRQVLEQVELSVPQGAVFGLLGPNGAGKTTLLSILFGLTRPTSGRVLVNGIDVEKDSRRARQGMSLVPQGLAFYPMLSGRENLDFFAKAANLSAKKRNERLAWCVDVAGLEKHLDDRAESYSGGLKRRLNLAIGLINKPRVLCLDEPTVGIDPQSRRFILDVLTGLSQNGMTIVYTSHYMEEVEQLCTHLAVLDQGRILVQGSKEEFLAARNRRLEITVKNVSSTSSCEALAAETGARFSGDRFIWETVQVGVLGQLLERIEYVGAQVCGVGYGQSGLEELFLDLTDRRLRD